MKFVLLSVYYIIMHDMFYRWKLMIFGFAILSTSLDTVLGVVCDGRCEPINATLDVDPRQFGQSVTFGRCNSICTLAQV